MRENAHVVEAAAVHPHVFGVDVEDALGEVAQRRNGVHLHPGEMRGVVVEAEALARNCAEHPAPDRRRDRQILSAGPFVGGEEHRAVLDADAHAVFFGAADERLPGFQKRLPIGFERPGPVASDEGVDARQSQFFRCANDLLDVRRRSCCFVRVGRQRIRIVTERADADAVLVQGRADAADFPGVEPVDVDVGDAGVAALRLAHRPTHDFHAVVTLGGGCGADLVEGQIGQNGGHKTELHAI